MPAKTKNEIVVPWSVFRRAGLKAGDRIEFFAQLGMITVRKVSTTPKRSKVARTIRAGHHRRTMPPRNTLHLPFASL
jgi:bifunctional DNA-binding transcriptional regulator/antitoxin component of YhaV-PrlF toxin-antitoxin module